MKTFNRTVFLFIALLVTAYGTRAQITDNSRYIEVTVSDTLQVKPDVIEFTLSLRQDYEYPTYETDTYSTDNPDYMAEIKKRQEEMKVKNKIAEKRMMELLEKEKISYTRGDSPTSFDYYPQEEVPAPKPFVLKFSSFEKMNQFKEKIPEDLKYNGDLTRLSCSKYAQMEEKLLEKLMLKAKKQAEKLASLSNVKLGPLLQFSDNTDNSIVKGIEQLLTTFMNKYERDKFFNMFREMQVSKTVRVRYAVE